MVHIVETHPYHLVEWKLVLPLIGIYCAIANNLLQYFSSKTTKVYLSNSCRDGRCLLVLNLRHTEWHEVSGNHFMHISVKPCLTRSNATNIEARINELWWTEFRSNTYISYLINLFPFMMQLVSQHQGVKVNNSLTCVLLKVPVLRNVN